MAEGLNKAILIGNLGQDPELKFTQGGQAVLKLRLATNETYVNKAGERQDRTEWHTIVVWGKRAEALAKILAKGRAICVEGRIQTRQWEDKEGHKRSTTEINAANIILLGGGRGEGGGAGRGGGGRGEGGGGGAEEVGDGFPSDDGSGGGGGGGGADDDIPF